VMAGLRQTLERPLGERDPDLYRVAPLLVPQHVGPRLTLP
jgi:hypothetical protein